MKKIISLLIVSIVVLVASIFGSTSFAMAADQPTDTITVNLKITKNDATSQASQNIQVELKQGGNSKDTKAPSIATQTDTQISYSPLIFSGNSPGNYQVCISQTDQCQNVTKKASAVTVNFSPTLSASDAKTISDGSTDSVATCGADTLDWLVCPAVGWIQRTVTGIEKNVIVPFLKTQPLKPTNQDGSMNPTYGIWQAIKNVANALFILIFLVIIFAQTSSFGVDAYTVKRSLPRLITAVILVQFSFYICSFGIDVANILGSGIQSLVNGVLNTSGAQTIYFSNLSTGIGLTAVVVGFTAVAGSLLSGAFIAMLVMAFFSVIGVFLTLIARQIIIVLLIILSPIAFVMWVLPNTQSFFTMWRQNFVKILMMYPLIVLLFSASRIVAMAATSSGNGFAKDVSALVALGAIIIPLFLVPWTFKFAGSMLVVASGWADKIASSGKSKTESSAGYQNLKNWSDNRKRMLAAGQGVNVGLDTPFGSVKRSVGRGTLGKIAGGGITNVGAASRTRGLQDMNKLRASTLKEMEDAGLNADGFKMVSRGRTSAAAMVKDAEIELARVRSNQAAGLATAADVALAEQNVKELKASEQVARKYYGNIAAQTAAAGFLGDKGMLEDADRLALARHMSRGGKTTEQYAELVWQDVRFKNIGGDPATSFTNLAGVVNVGALAGQINGRTPDKIAGITKGGWENIAKIGALDKLDTRTLQSATVGNNKTSPAGIKIIDEYREAQAALTLDVQGRGNFVAKYSILPGKYELLKKKSLLGGLIAAGSGDTVDEKALRREIYDALDRTNDIATFARVVENATVEEVKQEDYDDFVDYRNYWLSRVNPDGSKKP